MDAVGDAQDRVVDDPLPGRVGGHGVELADGVRAARQAQRERGHVELAGVAVDAEAELEDAARPGRRRHRAAAGDAPDEVGVEALVAGRDRRVDREDAVAPDRRSRRRRATILAATYSRARSASRNAEWPSLRCQTAGREPERADRPDAADAEHELLVEAHLAAADVQDVGDRPVGVGVLRHVRVEQQDRHAADLGEPDRDRQVAPGSSTVTVSGWPARPGRG